MSSESRPAAPSTASLPRRGLACARCGAEFSCGGGTGDGDACWCAAPAFRLPAELPAAIGSFTDCLCPTCLSEVAAEVGQIARGGAAR